MLYLIKTGCQWRNLPTDFPKWKAVQMFFYHAKQKGILEKAHQTLVAKTRKNAGKKENPTYALIDSQSVKTISASESRGFDGRKKRKEESDI
ncbi:MAG: transposase [Oscillospiraceae bacterium]|nr:transposase [Oscillospiraceae bacterium]